MDGPRYVWLGLKDAYNSLFHYMLASMAWWLGVVLVVTGPAATMALFAHTDPRIGTAVERMSWRETFDLVRRQLWRGWRLALLVIPALLLLSYNIAFYGGEPGAIGALTPFWVVLFVIGLLIAVSSFAVAMIRVDARALEVVRLSAILVGARLFHGLLMLLVLAVPLFVLTFIAFGRLFALPLLLIVPAMIATTVNRFVLAALQISITDPLDPTPERAAEAKQRRKWFGP